MDVFEKSRLIKSVIQIVKLASSRGQLVSIGIATTSYNVLTPYFSYPRKIDNWGYFIHIVCGNNEHASQLIDGLKKYCKYIFLDIEQKNKEFNSKHLIEKYPEVNFLPYLPNQLTVQSIVKELLSLKNKRILLFGHGWLAHKTMDTMLSTGTILNWCKSRQSSSEKYLKMLENFGVYEVDINNFEADFVVNLCSYSTEDLSAKLNASNFDLLDVGGKGSINVSADNSYRIRMLDASQMITSYIRSILMESVKAQRVKRTSVNTECFMVSGGYPGRSGDLVVDDCAEPFYVLGISNGRNGFSRRINQLYDVYEAE